MRRAFAVSGAALLATSLSACERPRQWSILDESGRAVEDAEGWVTFEYQVRVGNDGDEPVRLGGEIQFLDDQQTEIADAPLDPFVVGPQSQHVERGSATLEPDVALQVRGWRPTLDSY